MKTIIVEDNPEQADLLLGLLHAHRDKVKVVGAAKNVQEAKKLIKETSPDLVFLDVLLNKVNALVDLKDHWPAATQVIVTTGYDGYAISAFEINATAFLLKPVLPLQLSNAIDLAQQNFMRQFSNRMHQIVVKSVNSWHIIQLEKIVHVLASKGYTEIHLNDRKTILVSRSIGEVSLQLREKMGFVRVHKSHIINLKYVLEVKMGKHSSVVLTDQTEVPLAQRRRDAFFELLKQWPVL